MKYFNVYFPCLLFCFLLSCSAASQSLIIDADILRLERQIDQKNAGMAEVSGWRILILAEKDRRKMDRVLGEFYYTFPEFKPYSEWIFDDPYYKIVTGAFINKAHSSKILAKIRKEFPGAFEVSARLQMAEAVDFRRLYL